MSERSRLAEHPRLYIGAEEMKRLRQKPRLELLKRADREVAEKAEQGCLSPVFDYPTDTHNAHLIRARLMQTRVVSLLVRWTETGEERFREAVLDHVREIGGWEYWSWITWRQGDARPEAIFDLSYGENCATLAIAYDWLHGRLDEEERRIFREIAQERGLKPFLAHSGANKAHWFGRPDSNWNTVCAGGAGMLALATYEELGEARRVLPRVERSFEPYMRNLKETRGAWPEGIGYWNYGMRYAFMYLLSHERAAGKKHPLMKLAGVGDTLYFPADFCPNGVPCSFGDVNRWKPLPFHYATALRMGADELIPMFDEMLAEKGLGSAWPDAAELLLFHPRRKGRRRKVERDVVKLYRGMDWGVLADQLPQPNLYMAVRGGTTEVPHGHRDLLSFHCVVGSEGLIANVGVGEYLDTTFSSRRYELFETTPASKNSLMINGVGIAGGSAVKTRKVRCGRHQGVSMDSTAAMGEMRDGPVARFCGRLFLLLKEGAFLIVDRMELHHFGRLEARFHTYGQVKWQDDGALIAGEKERLTLRWVADRPAGLHQGLAIATTPGPGPKVLRWCTDKLHGEATFATLMVPGEVEADVRLEWEGKKLVVRAGIGGREVAVELSKRLRPV